MISQEVADLKDEMIRLCRDFHQHAELGFEEKWTAQYASRMVAFEIQCLLRTKDSSDRGRGYGESSPLHHQDFIFSRENDLYPRRIKSDRSVKG